MGNKQPKEAAKPAAARPSSAIESIGAMEKTQNLLTKRRDLLEKRCDGFTKTARAKMKKGDKKGALFALKQKKMYDKQVQNLDNQLLTLEQQKVALENANISATVVNTMAAGTTAMRNIQATMDVDSVNDMRDDLEEQMDMTNEINDAIGQPLGEAMDEDELLGELDDLVAEDTDMMMPDMLGVPSLPDAALSMPAAPSTAPVVAKQNSVDAELADLDALMM